MSFNTIATGDRVREIGVKAGEVVWAGTEGDIEVRWDGETATELLSPAEIACRMLVPLPSHKTIAASEVEVGQDVRFHLSELTRFTIHVARVEKDDDVVRIYERLNIGTASRTPWVFTAKERLELV